MSLDDLYREVILDHYRNPRNKRPLDGADIDLAHNNPLCGDEISVRVKVADGIVADAAFEGQGCSISQASASMLTEKIKGMKLDDLEDLVLAFRGMMAGKEGPDDDALGDLVALKGVVKYPVRIKCAVLAWDTLQEGVETYRKDSELGLIHPDAKSSESPRVLSGSAVPCVPYRSVPIWILRSSLRIQANACKV